MHGYLPNVLSSLQSWHTARSSSDLTSTPASTYSKDLQIYLLSFLLLRILRCTSWFRSVCVRNDVAGVVLHLSIAPAHISSHHLTSKNLIAFLYTALVCIKCIKGFAEFVTLPKFRVRWLFRVFNFHPVSYLLTCTRMRFCYCIFHHCLCST